MPFHTCDRNEVKLPTPETDAFVRDLTVLAEIQPEVQRIINHSPTPKMRWHYNYLWIVLGIAVWQKMFIDGDKFERKRVEAEDYYE